MARLRRRAVLPISPSLLLIGGMTLSLIERRCCSSGQKSILRSGVKTGICRAARLYRSTSAIGWRRHGTVLIVVSRDGEGEPLTRRKHYSPNLASHQSSGACHVDAA